MSKKPSMKGKGADIFLGTPKKQKSKPAKPAKPIKRLVKSKPIKRIEPVKKQIKQGKITVYLPQDLIEMLDNVWLDLRRINRKLRKSNIVMIALDELFRDYKEKHQDSTLGKHFDVKAL